MGSPPPRTVPTQPVDTRLTMAELLQQQETIRRDDAHVTTLRRRIETPKPLACDIESIERQYAAGHDWSSIASGLHQARPYQLPRARFDMIIDTGRTFAKTPLQKVMASLTGPQLGNPALEELYRTHEIGQVSKLPGGNLRVKVKSTDACLTLERTTVNILGSVFTFQAFDVLASKYFIDIANVDSDMPTDAILQRLFVLGCQPVYDTFREVNMATGITSATWRVYFLSSTCPLALIVNGSVCDQILFNNKLHPVHGKNAPYASERLPFGYRSLHGIDLLTDADMFPCPASETGTAPQRPSPHSSAPIAGKAPTRIPASSQQQRDRPRKTFAQMATIPAQPQPSLHCSTGAHLPKTPRTMQPHVGASHGPPHGATQLAVLSTDGDDALSISTHGDSTGRISPPASPPGKSMNPPLMLTNGGVSDGFVLASSSKKRRRGTIDFATLLTKQQPQPVDGIATTNYFQVLQTMEMALELKDVSAHKKYGKRRQIVPTNVTRPAAILTATETAFFVEKHHTKVKLAAKASPILAVTKSMLDDESTALLDTLSDRLVLADSKVDSAVKLLTNARNPDHVMKGMVQGPLAFNSAMALAMAGDGHVIDELAQLHAINRVLCASTPTEDVTFVTKWKRVIGKPLPAQRQDIFKECARWWTHSDSILELARASKALGLFELALMSTAPTLFRNDHWIQYLTGQPVMWIPAHHTRFLHPNTLLRLLRSEVGTLCMQQWREVQWQGHLFDDLEALRKLDGFYPDESSVLKVHVEAGQVMAIADGLSLRY